MGLSLNSGSWFAVLVLLVTLGSAAVGLLAQETTKDPDRLYADREHLQSAREAAAIWEARLAKDPRDFESAWKLSRASYWLGGHVTEDERRKQYERGMDAAMKAIMLKPDQPEGHFWLAADMGAMAESFGLRAGIKYRSPIKKELETVLMLSPNFQQGSADRALGRWYFLVPRLFGGSKDKSVEHLQRSLMFNPTSTASHYFLAETFNDMGRKDAARAEIQKTLTAPIDPDWAPEDREFKQKAMVLLGKL